MGFAILYFYLLAGNTAPPRYGSPKDAKSFQIKNTDDSSNYWLFNSFTVLYSKHPLCSITRLENFFRRFKFMVQSRRCRYPCDSLQHFCVVVGSVQHCKWYVCLLELCTAWFCEIACCQIYYLCWLR